MSIDGSKVKANASKHKAMSRERMKQELARIEKEIGEALEQAEVADESTSSTQSLFETPEAEPMNLIHRREKIKAALAKLEERKPEADKGSSDKDQINFTDADSRIMDTKDQGVVHAYNLQIAVDADNGFVVGVAMSNNPSDQRQLNAVLDSVKENTGNKPEKETADAGYFSAANIESCQAREIDPYIAATREGKQAGNSFDKHNFIYDQGWMCTSALRAKR